MVPIVVGYPSSEMFAAAELGEIALGGCVVMGEDPTHRCSACGEDVILEKYGASPWCSTCGLPLDGDPDDDPTGDAGRPLCGACDRNRTSGGEEAAGLAPELSHVTVDPAGTLFGTVAAARGWRSGEDFGVEPTLTAGQVAEQLVEDRVRAALPTTDGYRVFANVGWTGRTKHRGQLTDGEADLVIAHPDRGFLVVETKAGEFSRDAAGRRWAGRHELKPDPFTPRGPE